MSYRERAQHLQPHRGANEPGRGQFDGGAHALEVKPLGNRASQLTVIDAQDKRDIATIGFHRAQHFPQHDPGLDIDHVVLRQYRHRAGVGDASRFQRLRQRRVAEDDGHVQLGRRLQKAAVLVELNDRDVVTGGDQIPDHPDAE